MKVLPETILCAIIIVSCAPEAVKGYVVGQETKASMGSTMIWWSPKGEMNSRGIWEQLRKELVYSGISGTALKISYRESREYFTTGTTDNARPLNTLDLTYDIATDKEISYQDLRLLIISADSKEIVFKVLSEPGLHTTGPAPEPPTH